MKRSILIFISLLCILSWSSADADTLNKSPNHVYIATFNIYIFGNIESKYKDIDDWNATIDDSIPDRIANLARVIAVGGFLAFLTTVFGVYFRFTERFFNDVKIRHIILAVIVILAAGWAVTLARALAAGR